MDVDENDFNSQNVANEGGHQGHLDDVKHMQPQQQILASAPGNSMDVDDGTTTQESVTTSIPATAAATLAVYSGHMVPNVGNFVSGQQYISIGSMNALSASSAAGSSASSAAPSFDALSQSLRNNISIDDDDDDDDDDDAPAPGPALSADPANRKPAKAKWTPQEVRYCCLRNCYCNCFHNNKKQLTIIPYSH